ncbi:MAG: PIN domain-containing protein [Myxococcota bacterium]|nr:PIN domain-containing protein [Myxococcota bacterium]
MSSTTSKVFVDTNILIYSTDTHDPNKRSRCRRVLRALVRESRCALSTQVLQEFYVVATKKLGLDPIIAKEIIDSFENVEVVQVTTNLIKAAIDTSVVNLLSFWDALIVVSAESAACSYLLTEDMNHQQVVRGVRILNPFKDEGVGGVE